MAEFKRKREIKLLIDSIGDGKIKIITGVRRCGKTYLLKMLLPKALKKEKKIRTIDDVLIIELKGKHNNIKTKNQLKAFLSKNKKYQFIVFDEIQVIRFFSEFLIEYKNGNPTKELFITGSNSKTLSSDITKSFKEYKNEIHLSSLTFKEIREEIPNYSIDKFLQYGGIPIVLNQDEGKQQIEIDSIYTEIYEGDIKDRIKGKTKFIKGSNQISDILDVLFSTTSDINTNKIAKKFLKGIPDYLSLMSDCISDINIIISALIDSYLILPFDISPHNADKPYSSFEKNKKYYCVDIGILRHKCKDATRVNSIVLENAVYLELCSRHIDVTGLILNQKESHSGEIDFYNKNMSLQVTWDLFDGNYYREIENLETVDSILKSCVFKTYNLTKTVPDDIECINIESFLLSE